MPGFANLAEIEAFEQTPLEERNLPDSTYSVLQRTTASYPDRTALTFFLQGTDYTRSVSFTYSQWLGRMNQTANMFHDLGLRSTDTVSYILPNLPQTYLTLYGGEAAGVANPINPLLEPHVLADIMRAANTKILVTLAPFPTTDIWEKVAAIVDEVPTLETILQVDLANFLGGIKKIAVRLMGLRKPKISVRARVLDFDKTVARYPADHLVSGRKILRDDVASLFHTGGTTGTPKLAMHTHFNEVFDAWAVATAGGLKPGEVNYVGLPLFHNYGAIAIGMGTWISGGTVILGTPQGFRGEGVIDNFWKILGHYQCTAFSGVPTLFSTLLNVPAEPEALKRLDVATCGAAPLPVEVARQFVDKFGIRILEGYGLTEGTSVSSVNPRAGQERIGSIGLRFPYQEMRIGIVEGTDFVRFCEPDEVGVVLLRGPNVFAGYKEAFHNEGAFIDTGDGGEPWLNTGDMGRQDEDGYFWLTGRKKEIIIRGGHNIDPKLIEEPLHEHPAVALAAAVGRPDAHAGELPVVYVELKPGQSATVEELRAFAREAIGERAAVPKEIYIVDQIPLTAVGKIFKPTLTREQVVEVYTVALTGMEGVDSFEVVAEGDKRLGTVARVRVTPAMGVDQAAVEEAIRHALGQYTIYYDLSFGQ